VGRRVSIMGVIAATATLLLAGCTSGGDSGPTSTSTSSVQVTAQTAPSTSTSFPGGGDPPPNSTSSEAPSSVTVPAEATLPMPSDSSTVQAVDSVEAADRIAIEAVWFEFWTLMDNLTAMPSAERVAEANKLMLDPVKSRILDGAAKNEAQGATEFGRITLHPYWYRPVDGAAYAVLGDCIDFSQSGTVDSAGQEVSRGRANVNTVGSFVRDEKGNWKLWQLNQVRDLPCTVAG